MNPPSDPGKPSPSPYPMCPTIALVIARSAAAWQSRCPGVLPLRRAERCGKPIPRRPVIARSRATWQSRCPGVLSLRGAEQRGKPIPRRPVIARSRATWQTDTPASCHCEEQSDVAIPMRLDTRRRTAVATTTRLPRYARNDKAGTRELVDHRDCHASLAMTVLCPTQSS